MFVLVISWVFFPPWFNVNEYIKNKKRFIKKINKLLISEVKKIKLI